MKERLADKLDDGMYDEDWAEDENNGELPLP